MRVLILDFDFYSARGGGQTFYRRMVERHPQWQFYYPSRGPDMTAEARARMPANAHPFALDQSVFDAFDASVQGEADINHMEPYYANLLGRIAVSIQGRTFDLVELPSFFPIAHRVRALFAVFGIRTANVSVALLGWLSVGVKNAYAGEVPPADVTALEALEARCVAAADVVYTISDLHAAENRAVGRPCATIDMHDALEAFEAPAAAAPGEGPPDLWYVGRLDRNKGPDVFIDMVSRLSRDLYGRVYLTGPDNPWATGIRWSQEVLAQAAVLRVEAEYLGELSDAALRARVYQGRSVVVIPSRSDVFNYVALEALLNGCPLVLSKNAGAADFLRLRHPDLAPPIIDPDDVAGAADQLGQLLRDYPSVTGGLRARLRADAWTQPRQNFMSAVVASAEHGFDPADLELNARIARSDPLSDPYVAGARLARPRQVDEQISVVVLAGADAKALALTLLSLFAWPEYLPGIVVVDDGAAEPGILRDAVRDFAPTARLVRHGSQGFGAALNTGLDATDAAFVCFVRAGEGVDVMVLADLGQRLRDQPAMTAIEGRGVDVDGVGRELPSRVAASAGPAAVFARPALEAAGGFNVANGGQALTQQLDRLREEGSVLRAEALLTWRWPADSRANPALAAMTSRAG